MTAGDGLNGGGTIAATRTFSVDSGSILPYYSSSIFGTVSGDVTITDGGVAKVGDGIISSSTQIISYDTFLLNTTDTLTGDLTVTGTITAQEFHTEFISASIIFTSGSTQFGNSSDDIHTFSGSINVKDAGHITASGNISSSGTGSFEHILLPEGSGRGRITWQASAGDQQFIYGKDNQITIDGDEYVNIYSDSYTKFYGGYVHAKSYITTESHITASGNISASGHITASAIWLPGGNYITWADDQSIMGQNNSINIDGDNFIKLKADNEVRFQDTSGTIFTTIDPNTGNIYTSGSITQITHITASGNISSSVNIYAADYFDDGTNINTIYSPIAGGSGIVTIGTVTSGNVTAILPSGTISGSAQVDHDTTTNFEPNEHIDHTGVTMTAGDGLNGGGTIAATRTFSVDSGSILPYYSSSIFSRISGDVAITAVIVTPL